MLEVDHPNIIKLFGVYESNGSVYLVLECLKGGELMNKISEDGMYSEKDARKILRKLLTALIYLHERNIMHRDLKPENILLKEQKDTEYDIKLADFGLSSRTTVKEYLYSKCGTPGFVAPEIFNSTEKYGVACDIFSSGIIFYML